jgi:UDP-N-acetylmuramoyl-L-alanyl-D-glutamate--2,6-diaminopimelate ligase
MTRVRKKLSEVVAGLDVIESQGDLETLVSGVQHDSRRVESGDVFVAIAGMIADGHRFVGDAASRGAAAAVVSRPMDLGVLRAIVRVAQTRLALAHLAANLFEHPSLAFALIGITGTNGKTTLTYLLESVIQAAGGVPGVVSTVSIRHPGYEEDNLYTTPESSDLQAMLHRMRQAGATHVAMEVTSHGLDLQRVRGCHFKVAVFTNLSRDHLDYHKDIDSYAAAKALLFSRELQESRAPGKVAVANRDDPRWEDVLRGWKGDLITFGHSDAADVHPLGEVDYSLDGFTARVASPLGEIDLRCHLTGSHNLDNAMAAVAVAAALEIPAEAVARGVDACARVPGRLERVDSGRGPAVFVDYAHTDQALSNVLGALRELTPGRLLVVFGCGGDRDRGKRPLMGKAVAAGADLAVVTSDNPRTEDPQAIIEAILPGLEGWSEVEASRLGGSQKKSYVQLADRREAIRLAVAAARDDDVLLIAGKGHETYQIIGATRHDFDDREVARAALQERE